MHRTLFTAFLVTAALPFALAGCTYQDDGTDTTNGDTANTVDEPDPVEQAAVLGGPELSTHLADIESGEEGDRLNFDLYHFVKPNGWSMHGMRGDTEVVRVFIKGDVDDPDSKITVYRRRAASPNVENNATAYAADWGGEIQDTSVTLGGDEAKLIAREHPGDGLQIVEAVLCRWMVEDFIIQAEAKPGESVRQVILDMASSWQWRGGG